MKLWFVYFVCSGDEAVVPVEDAERDVVWVPGHESHEESVVADIVRSGDHQVEQVPNAGILKRECYVCRPC